jgi:hypothetical protein
MGLEIKFKRDDHLLDFAEVIEAYLRQTGLDTITHQVDPQDPTAVLSVVTDYAKFDLQTVITEGRTLQAAKFDRYDRNNDDSAVKWFKNSLDPALSKDVSERLCSTDGFAAHWMQMIWLVQSTSFNRFQTIKQEIESELTIFKFPGQSVKDLASAFISKAKELENFGMYEHRLTLVMLDRFLKGGGTSDEVPTQMYRHHLFDLRAKLDKALMTVSSLDKNAQAQMLTLGLTYCQVCTTAKENWKQISDDNKWAPAKVKSDRRNTPSSHPSMQKTSGLSSFRTFLDSWSFSGGSSPHHLPPPFGSLLVGLFP